MRAETLETAEADLSSLVHRRDELRFLLGQADAEKSSDEFRHDMMVEELAEVERRIDQLSGDVDQFAEDKRQADEEDLLRQERIR